MNSKNHLLYKTLVIGILILFIGAVIAPSIGGDYNNEQDPLSLTFYTFDRTGTKECKVELSTDIAEKISYMFEELKYKITNDPVSGETKSLKNDFVEMLDVYGFIPQGLSKDYVFSLLDPWWLQLKGNNPFATHGVRSSRALTVLNDVILAQFSRSGSAFFCSLAGSGRGLIFTPIIFPRPRLLSLWSAYSSAVSTAANLYTGHGFIASGGQTGVALGFWGIGLSFAFPGEPAVFGFGGYALLTLVTADDIETYPLNQVPIISDENPPSGTSQVPVSLSELSFYISDADSDRMNYNVTTDPDIGSGDGQNKRDGFYKVPVSGLQSNTEYSWHVVVSDGEDSNEEFFSFRTEVEAPIVSNPLPVNSDGWVSVDLSELSFTLKDLQGDSMDYTVETSPDIGSDSVSGVGDGTYTVDVGGLDYTTEYSWFVNVTDGECWAREIFVFKTEPIMVFDPFVEGWMYRKEITIDHNMVDGDLIDFPVLISLVDPDLKNKAQVDGDDILFMDGSGVANRLFHEIELYVDSSGELLAWVNVSALSSAIDTVFYIYYGNPNCCSQQYPGKVWDSSYCGVWHLSELSGTVYDSTFNDNDGTIYGGAQWVNGISGYALDFDGVDDFVDILDTSDFEFANQDLTFSAWVQIFDNVNHYRAFMSLADASDQHGLPKINLAKSRSGGSDGRIYFELQTPTEHNLIFSNADGDTLPKFEWIYLTGVVDYPDSLKLYVNAEFQDSDDLISFDMEDALSLKLYFGSAPYPGYNSEYLRHKGLIDEVHISNTNRNAKWISTEYNNQNDPSSFFRVGSEESAP